MLVDNRRWRINERGCELRATGLRKFVPMILMADSRQLTAWEIFPQKIACSNVGWLTEISNYTPLYGWIFYLNSKIFTAKLKYFSELKHHSRASSRNTDLLLGFLSMLHSEPRNYRIAIYTIYPKSDTSDDISMKFDHPDQKMCPVCSKSDISVSVIS